MKRLSSKYKSNDNFGFKRRKHIHHLEIVQKYTIYGMWSDKIIFIKAVLYDPADITKLGAILQVNRKNMQFQS